MSSSKRKRCDRLRESNKKIAQDPTTRSISPQTWYNIDAIENEGFEMVAELLKAQGWSFLVSRNFGDMAGGYDIDLVRQFYSNLQVADNETTLTTKIYNKNIIFAHTDITKFISALDNNEGNLTVENTGLKLKFKENGGNFPNFNPETDVGNLLQPCFKDVSQPTTSHLKVHNHLLLHIIYNTVLPRKGSLTYIPKLVFALLHYLNTKIKINFAILIMGHMLNVSQSSTSTLPHATLITYWLKTVFKIKTKSPSVCTYLLYDHTTLSHMFHYDANTNTWTTKKPHQSSSLPSDPSLSTNDTPNFTTPPSIQIPNPQITSPVSASSSVKHTMSSIPVMPYTPTAPGYSPFPGQPNPSPSSSSQPPLDSFMENVMNKLDALKINTPSISTFNSACEQLFALIREYQTSSTITLRRIEEKVDAYEDKMKGYGHHSYECMQEILKAQREMAETQSSMKQLQLGLIQEFLENFPKNTPNKRGSK